MASKLSDEEKQKQVMGDVEVYLRGPSHAIRSIAYAPDHDLILGAGFDYDVSQHTIGQHVEDFFRDTYNKQINRYMAGTPPHLPYK